MINEMKHILVYKDIHKKLKNMACEKETSITKVVSNILRKSLKLENGGGDNGK